MAAAAAPAPRRPHALAWLALLALVLGSLWLRHWAQGQSYEHPDEGIAIAVAGRVLDEGTLDTNWARSPVDAEFRYDQYNFSAYHLAAAAWLGVWRPPVEQRLASLRWLSALLHALAVAATAWLAWRWGGTAAAAVAAPLTALSPTLLQDSLYARPEAFVTLLTLALVLLLGRDAAPGPRRMAFAGGLLGLLLATKVSFLALVPVALALTLLPGARRPRAASWLAFGAALLAGFALGAPFALLQPQEYLHGIHYLLRQYGGGHLPHGLPDAALAARLGFGLQYLRHTAGSIALLLALLGAWQLWRARHWHGLLLAAGVLATLVYFLQTRAFFERNLSHALPLGFVLAGIGAAALAARATPRRSGRMLLLAALGAAAAWVPAALSRVLLQDALPGQLARARDAAQAALAAAGHVVVPLEPMAGGEPADRLCGTIALRDVDYGHPVLRAGLDRQLQARGYRLQQHLPGPFAALPTSTLHTYHAADLRYHVPRVAWPDTCAVGLQALPHPATVRPLPEVAFRLEGDAARDGQEPGAALPGWPAPIYGTHAGSDAHRGAVLATIRACRDFLLPVVSGPTRHGSRFRIARGADVLFDGALPPVLGSWSALRVRHRGPACAEYEAQVRDADAGWGAWGALGHPLEPLDPVPSTASASP